MISSDSGWSRSPALGRAPVGSWSRSVPGRSGQIRSARLGSPAAACHGWRWVVAERCTTVNRLVAGTVVGAEGGPPSPALCRGAALGIRYL